MDGSARSTSRLTENTRFEGGDFSEQMVMGHIREVRKREKRRLFLEDLVRSWPVIVGVGLAFIAPDLRDMVSQYHPWGMRLLFPVVALAERPEVQVGNWVTRLLPQVLLYLQFPAEGLLARMTLKHRVTLPGVARQVLFYHFLGATHLWLLSGLAG